MAPAASAWRWLNELNLVNEKRTEQTVRGKTKMENGHNGHNGHNGQSGRGANSEARSALRSAAAERVYGKHGGYRNLTAYRVAEMLYDYTCRFCDRYIPFKDRHHDQMVQSARSGYQNIAEGSEDSATSRKLEMNLTNVAKSSLGELARDYRKHLTRRKLPIWQQGERLFEEARALRPNTLEEAAAWVNQKKAGGCTEERAANLGAILAAQAHYLSERLLDRHARDFENEGGFSERLYQARIAQHHGRNQESRGGETN